MLTPFKFVYHQNKSKTKQVYHSNATTNIKLRGDINNSKFTNKQLSIRYRVSTNTISQ